MSLDAAAMVERRDLPVMPVKIRGGAQPLIPVSDQRPRECPPCLNQCLVERRSETSWPNGKLSAFCRRVADVGVAKAVLVSLTKPPATFTGRNCRVLADDT